MRTELEVITDMLGATSFDARMTTLVTSVIRHKCDALDSAAYLVKAAAVMAMALSANEKVKLVDTMRDVSDELEQHVLARVN